MYSRYLSNTNVFKSNPVLLLNLFIADLTKINKLTSRYSERYLCKLLLFKHLANIDYVDIYTCLKYISLICII